MEGQLYIRVRGRVLGPYDREKLRDQVRRGQLSRMHEVSEDGVAWNRASNYADLFEPSADGATNGSATSPLMQPVQSAAAQSSSVAQAQPQAQAVAVQPGAAGGHMPLGVAAPMGGVASRPAWYYTQGDQEIGPVDFTQLQQAVSQGTITAEDQVWTEGMADWTSPTQVRGLSVRKAPAARAAEPVAVRDDASDIPAGALRILASSRGWVLFITVCMFLIALPTGFWGLFITLSGAGKTGGEAVIFMGLTILVQAIIYGTGGLLLARFYSRTGEAMLSRKSIHLERTLSALNGIWIFVSSLFIVGILAMIVMLVLMVLVASVGSSLRGSFNDVDTNLSSRP